MANATVTENTIQIHGRGSLVLPFKVFDDGIQRDISGDDYYFEVDGVSIRKALVADPDDAEGLLIQLTNTEVQTLKKTATNFVVRDESSTTYPIVSWSGTISRTGFIGNPDAVED